MNSFIEFLSIFNDAFNNTFSDYWHFLRFCFPFCLCLSFIIALIMFIRELHK